MDAVSRPIVIFINTGIRDGQVRLVFDANYVGNWVVFIVLALVVYGMAARMTFRHLLAQGTTMGFSSAAAIVTGLFFVTVAFYPSFAFSKVAAAAWHAQIALSLAWLIMFIFMAVSAPAPR